MDSITAKKQRFQLTNKGKELLILMICLLFIFLFLYTACAKLMEQTRFLNGLYHVKAIRRFALYISWLVPLSEIVISVLLAIPQTVKWGLYSFLGLSRTFLRISINFTINLIEAIFFEKHKNYLYLA